MRGKTFSCTGILAYLFHNLKNFFFMKNWIFIFAFSLFSVGTLMPEQAQAQRVIGYETSVGVRLSPFYGASIKHFFQGSSAVEGILHTRWNAIKVTGLYEKHQPAFDEPGLNFYYGGGAHIGFLNGTYYSNDAYNSGALLGIDGVLGLEYTIQDTEIPLNVSLDWKPVFEFAPLAGFWGSEAAITVRYILR